MTHGLAPIRSRFLGVALVMAGCVSPRPSLGPPSVTVTPSVAAAPESLQTIAELDPAHHYTPVSASAAMKLGCRSEPGAASSPVCETAEPTTEELTAFLAEAERLLLHPAAECRRLGDAVRASIPQVRMYRKALVKRMGAHRYYGVGHAYSLDDVWLVRVARRIDDLNPRTIDEMKRTLRHEVSHTIGAEEEPGRGWTANDYARNCA